MLTAHYSLSATHYSLLTAHYSLLTAHDSLLTTYCSLLTTHCRRARFFWPVALRVCSRSRPPGCSAVASSRSTLHLGLTHTRQSSRGGTHPLPTVRTLLSLVSWYLCIASASASGYASAAATATATASTLPSLVLPCMP